MSGLTWASMDSAPHDRRILVWNPMTGTYATQYQDGQWPMHGWHALPGVWYPVPVLWTELPVPSASQRQDTAISSPHSPSDSLMPR